MSRERDVELMRRFLLGMDIPEACEQSWQIGDPVPLCELDQRLFERERLEELRSYEHIC